MIQTVRNAQLSVYHSSRKKEAVFLTVYACMFCKGTGFTPVYNTSNSVYCSITR